MQDLPSSSSLAVLCVVAVSIWGCSTASEDTEGPQRHDDTAPLDPESASPWHCDDGEDNDLDELVDCDDPDCQDSAYCTEFVDDGDCADGEDNDGDGAVDCEDSDCEESSECEEPDHESPDAGECDDGEDNDGDGLIDCEDEDCFDHEACQEDQSGDCEDSLEIDIFGPVAPSVGDSWTVWLRCEGTTLIGTLVLRFSPPDFATIDKNEVTFRSTGTATMIAQVGGYRATMDVTVVD